MDARLHGVLPARHPPAGRGALLVEHERRVRSELAVLVTEALEERDGIPTLPVDELARMIVAVSEGSDIQVLTDAAAGAVVHAGPRAPRRDGAAPALLGADRVGHRPEAGARP